MVRSVRNLNSDCTQDTENFLLIVSPSALNSLTLGMVGTAVERITTARRNLGDVIQAKVI